MTFISLGFAFILFLQFILTIFNTRQESPVSVDRSTTNSVQFCKFTLIYKFYWNFYSKRSYFWLVYIRRRLRRLFAEISPYSRLESFSFSFLRGTFTTHCPQGGKTWVLPFAGGAFIFAVKLYNKMFRRAFYKDLS